MHKHISKKEFNKKYYVKRLNGRSKILENSNSRFVGFIHDSTESTIVVKEK